MATAYTDHDKRPGQRPLIRAWVASVRCLLAFWVVVPALVGWAAWPAVAQTRFGCVNVQWPGRWGGVSNDPIIISAQLRVGIDCQQLAIQQLGVSSSRETLQEVGQMIHTAYVQVRVAHGGIGLRITNTRGFIDPLLQWENQAIELSRKHILAAHFQIVNASPGEAGRIQRGIQELQAAMVLIEQVLTLMP